MEKKWGFSKEKWDLGHFVRKNREYWGEKWTFGAVCEGISAILGEK